MNNTTHDALSAREMQQLAVAALDELLSHDLPELNWYFSLHMRKPELTAQVSSVLSDAERCDVVRRWADFLKAEYTEERTQHDTFTTVETVGEFENVTVRIWTHVAETDE